MSTDVKQTTADFELYTRIRHISQEVLQILLKNHDNVFEFVKQNRTLLQSFDERIRNNETLCGLIDGKIDSRLNRIDVLGRDIRDIVTHWCELYKDFCYLGLKNVSSDVSYFQRQMDEVHTMLRSQRPLIEKTSTDVERLDIGVSDLKQSIATLQETTHERAHKYTETNTSRIDKIRADFDKMLGEAIQAREALLTKQERLTELTQDIELFKVCRPEINDKIAQLFHYVEGRAHTADLLAHRKLYDDKVMGYFENVNRTVGKLDADVKKRIKANEYKTQLIFKDQYEIANRLRTDMENGARQRKQEQEQLLTWINTRFNESDDKLKELKEKIEQALDEKYQSIDALQKYVNLNHNQFLKQSSYLLEQLIKQEKECNSHMELIRNGERISDSIKLELTKLGDRIDAVGRQTGSGTGRIQYIEAEFEKIRRMIEKEASRTDDTNSTIGRVSTAVGHLNDRINKLNEGSLLLRAEMTSIAEKQSYRMDDLRRYSDQTLSNFASRFSEIREYLKILDTLKEEMKSFTIRFAEQIAANEQFSRSVTERLETTVAQLTKFRSDMAIRLETSNKEIVKVGGEIRAVEKQQIAFVASISTIVEVVTAVSACQLSFYFEAANDKIKEETNQKYSSLFDGFVLELDGKSTQDSFKYRGEIVRRLSLLSSLLQYLLKDVDGIRKNDTLGKGYYSGKTIFQAMQPSKKYSSEEGRRASLSMRTVNKRGDSFVEFPKLNKKE